MPLTSAKKSSIAAAQPLRVSVVIPIYNEEKHIFDCLTALGNLTVKPYEIMLVDNGCTDKTIAIAKQFPVRVIKEPMKGITYARTRGFNSAKGDIIARIDADTMVRPDWLSRIQQHFMRDPQLVGVGGTYGLREFSPKGRYWFTWPHRLFRMWHQWRIGVKPMLYGNNCAIKRSVWQRVAGEVSMGDDRISEDVEVTILINREGKTLYDPHLIVNCHMFNTVQPEKLSRYIRTDNNTIALHKKKGNLPSN